MGFSTSTFSLFLLSIIFVSLHSNVEILQICKLFTIFSRFQLFELINVNLENSSVLHQFHFHAETFNTDEWKIKYSLWFISAIYVCVFAHKFIVFAIEQIQVIFVWICFENLFECFRAEEKLFKTKWQTKKTICKSNGPTKYRDTIYDYPVKY